jgi:hypothetical protein
VLASGVGLAMLVGLAKVARDFRTWRNQMGRERSPWERA